MARYDMIIHAASQTSCLCIVSNMYRITQDASGFLVTKPDGKQLKFTELLGGLYILDTLEFSGIVLVYTVAETISKYTIEDYS